MKVAALADPVLGALDTLGAVQSASGPSIYVTGHSLGAAIAQIFAYELALAGYPVEGIWTFGAPRAGNRAFAESYESAVIRGSVQADSIVWGSWASANRPTLRRRALDDSAGAANASMSGSSASKEHLSRSSTSSAALAFVPSSVTSIRGHSPWSQAVCVGFEEI